MNQTQPIINNLTPIGFRSLLKLYKKDDTTSGGMILPETENSGMPVVAQISVLGKKTWWEHALMILGLKRRYKVGQWVYFRKYSVDELQVNTADGQLNLFVLEEDEVIGLINQL